MDKFDLINMDLPEDINPISWNDFTFGEEWSVEFKEIRKPTAQEDLVDWHLFFDTGN